MSEILLIGAAIAIVIAIIAFGLKTCKLMLEAWGLLNTFFVLAFCVIFPPAIIVLIILYLIGGIKKEENND